MNIDTLQSAIEQSVSGARPSAAQATPPVSGVPVQAKTPAPAPNVESVKAAAKQIESYLKSNGRSLEFRVDADTHELVVTVRDPETGETIRQIPSAEALQLARSLSKTIDSAPALVNLSV